MPRVAIHVVTYNNSATITRCLESVLVQQNTDFGLLVIDNHSTDGTADQVRQMGLPLIANDTNAGYAAAHNQALAHTSSDYVLTLNPDVWLSPAFVARITAALDQTPEAGSAAGCILRVNRLGDAPYCVDSTGLTMNRYRRQRLRGEGLPVAEGPRYATRIFGPDGAVAVYRRAMLDDIRVLGEVFDSAFYLHKEDVDICWRAQLRGWSSVYVPDAVAHHVRAFRPGQRRAVPPLLRFYAVRNRYLLMMKNEIAPHFWRDLWAIMGYDLGIVGYVSLRERDSWRALRAAWALRGAMIAKRRIIQARRRVCWRDIQHWFE